METTGEVKQQKGLQIIELVAEEFKALKAVTITPKGSVVVLSGANGAGKSSVLDAIWAGIDAAGFMKATKTVKPIKDGAKRGMIQLTLGSGGVVELVVTRKINPSGITVEVANPDGSTFKSPQAILDALTGAISFDPLSFAMKKEAEQLKQVLELVTLEKPCPKCKGEGVYSYPVHNGPEVDYQDGECDECKGTGAVLLDLDEWTAQRKEIFDTRTIVNREVDQAEAIYKALPVPDADTPDVEVPAADVLARQQLALDKKRQNDEKRQQLTEARVELRTFITDKDRFTEQEAELESQIRQLQAKLDETKTKRAEIEKTIETKTAAGISLGAEVDALEDPNMEEFQTELNELEEKNKAIRAKIQRAAAVEDFKKKQKESLALTDKLEDHDTVKREAIKAAKFPVDGLGFDDTGLTFNGIPFTQASSAQRLRVSLAIAIALNPRLRVLRVADGSLLDSKSMAVIEEMCAEHGYQVWIEKVDESGKVGVYIEDGAVVAEN